MKLEIASQSYISNDTVNTFPHLVHTARQAMEAGVYSKVGVTARSRLG